MNFLKFSTLWVLFLTVLFSVNISAQKSFDKEIDALVSKMSIEEKVGQMTQVTIDLILKDSGTEEIDEVKLKKTILEKHVGSILNVKEHAYSYETWHKIQNALQKVAVKESPNNIPILYGIDAIHGPTYISGATLFPHNSGMGATRNVDLVHQSAVATAAQTRATGVTWNFDPVLGLARNPLWSRFDESFGEDSYLATQLGIAAIKGYEEKGLSNEAAVAACMKHYIGYSIPQSGKDRTPSLIPENVLREYLLPPFKAAVDAGVTTVMINSGEVNGVPVHASKYLLTEVLRDELGFEGVAVSDWEDVIRLHTRHKMANTPKEAVRLAVEAGLDMSMVPYDYSFYDYLVELVKEGSISEARLDVSVRRILKLKFKLGLFDNPYPNTKLYKKLPMAEYDKMALESARESMTLLKNEGNVLPLPKTAKVLLVGPAANNLTSLHSCWSYSWLGRSLDRYPSTTKTIKETFTDALGASNVICSSDPDFMAATNYDVSKIKQEAEGVDYIILCLGERAYAEGMGLIDDLNLDDNQLELAKAAIATGKKVILVLTEGRPRVISKIEKEIPGILMAYRPSTMGAKAITEVLLGDYNPNGKLPFSYPVQSNNLVTYDHKGTDRFRGDSGDPDGSGGYAPAYPFGHGLSYTTFAYSDMKTMSTTFSSNRPLEISVVVKNTGKEDGKIAVELYSRDLYASVTPSYRRLRKFTKIALKAGESKTVNFTVAAKDVQFIGQDGKWRTEAGDFDFFCGDQKLSVKYMGGTSGKK